MLKRFFGKMNDMPLSFKIVFWYMVCSVLEKSISILTIPIFTRLLTSSEYGELSVFNSWISILKVFVTLNLFSGVFLQGLVKFETERDVYSASLQGLVTTLTIVWTVIYFCFKDFWNNIFSLSTNQVLFMLIIIWTNAIFAFWSIEQRVEFKYKNLVRLTIIVILLKPILGIFFVVYSEDKVVSRILSMVIVNLFAYSWLYFVKLYKVKTLVSFKFWKYGLLFNLPLLPHYLSTVILSNSDRIMIDAMVGASKTGIYNLAYSLATLMLILNSSLMSAIEPWLYKKIKLKEFKSISRLAYPLFALVAVINLFVIAFAPELIMMFAPPEYYDAIWVLPPVAMSVFFMFTYAFFATFEFYYEKRIYVTVSTILGAAFNILLNYIFIDIFGYYAAGYTTLACYIIYAAAHYIFMKKISKNILGGIKIYNEKKLLFISLSFVGLGFVFLLTYKLIILRYILIIILILILILLRQKIIIVIKNVISIRQER